MGKKYNERHRKSVWEIERVTERERKRKRERECVTYRESMCVRGEIENVREREKERERERERARETRIRLFISSMNRSCRMKD